MNGSQRLNKGQISRFVSELKNSILNAKADISAIGSQINEFQRIYIPTLRGLRKIDAQKNEDLYLERTLIDYFSNDDGSYPQLDNIFTGLTFYEDIKKLLLGPQSDLEIVSTYEEFLSKNFFEGKIINLIPRHDDDVVHVRIDNVERPIHQLGDGIQAIIVLTYPLFLNKDKNLLAFIEEPEHFLHPGFQRVFIETLLKPEFSKFQYFITTHSNHLLDITLDVDNVSVYTFNKKNEDSSSFQIENIDNDNIEILSLIGARNSSVFLTNCTIWVEGITDRIYLRKYLELFQKNQEIYYQEDLHYSFVEYGGGNITHWSFLESKDKDVENIIVDRMCGISFLVTDNDGAGYNKDGSVPSPSKQTAKYLRHKELEKKLGERYYLLESREIENLLPPEVIENVIRDYEKNNTDLDFKNLTLSKYQKSKLGKYLDDKIIGKKRKYSTDSGTIKDKVVFAKKAVSHISDFNQLTTEAKKLTEKIYYFIKENN